MSCRNYRTIIINENEELISPETGLPVESYQEATVKGQEWWRTIECTTVIDRVEFTVGQIKAIAEFCINNEIAKDSFIDRKITVLLDGDKVDSCYFSDSLEGEVCTLRDRSDAQ